MFNISYPSVEYVTNVELEASPTWTDPQANWTNVSGTSALWLSGTPWIMNAMNNVPIVWLDKIQSFQYLVSGNDVNFNIIDAWYNDTTEINTVYKYNTAEEQTAHVAENHGTSTVSLWAWKINGLHSVGTNPWAKVRAIDAWVNSGFIVTDVQEWLDLLNTQIATTPNNGQVLNCSFSWANSAIWQAKVATFATHTGWKWMIVVATGNSGNNTMNPLAEVPYTVGIWAVNSQSNTRSKWSGSSWGGTLSDPRHVFAMADGNNTWIPNVSWTFSQWNGTSYASPLAAGQMSTYQMFFPNHTNAQIQEAFANTAYDLQTTWHDIQTGYWYLQAHKALVYGSSMSLPSTVDAGSNGAYSFQFTPETLNDATLASQTLLYPNGLPVPYTVGGDGKRTYTIAVNTNNGFVNWANSLTYTVVAPAPYAWCTLSWATKKITVSNIGTLSNEEFAQQSPNIAIAPNPVNDILTFKSNKTIKKAEVYSIDGKLLDHDMNLMDNKLDLSHIANGMVIVVFVADDSTSTQVKVLVNHNQR